ncbi:hypothetical protein IHE55_23710 [Streptomyces pactum]|uniref:Uncharacterized protein n=1 Tax=Streptomyces pactum TaxID=68249 RepID=A0ABS0NRD2_9ACTN|nr:hypothetical protein [Streptomyces pactum]MBH5337609.1 hypothetical protein [Streptomyces pactum]
MCEPVRRGRRQLPPERMHRTSLNFSPVGLNRARGGRPTAGPGALIAALILLRALVTDTAAARPGPPAS